MRSQYEKLIKVGEKLSEAYENIQQQPSSVKAREQPLHPEKRVIKIPFKNLRIFLPFQCDRN